MLTKDVDHSPLLEIAQRLSLGLAHVRGPHVFRRVVNITVIRRDVVVTGHDDVGVRRFVRLEMSNQTFHPRQLVSIVVVIEFAPVGHVHRTHPDTSARRGHQTCLRIRRLTVGETTHGILEAHSADDGHTVPLTLAMMHRFVPERTEHLGGKSVLGQLGFLHAHHVGPHVGEPFLDARHTRAQRIDVPGGKSHDRTVGDEGVPRQRRRAVAFLVGAGFLGVTAFFAVATFLGAAFLGAAFLVATAFFTAAFLGAATFFTGAALGVADFLVVATFVDEAFLGAAGFFSGTAFFAAAALGVADFVAASFFTAGFFSAAFFAEVFVATFFALVDVVAGFRSMLRRPGMISTTSRSIESPNFMTSRADRGGGLLYERNGT